VNVAVEIIRFVSWEPQPGIVACELKDAEGQVHTFVDKIPIFTSLPVDERSPFPLSAHVRCGVLRRWRDAQGRELLCIRTDRAGVESTTGLSQFVVSQRQVSAGEGD
jgi:hypothetical protein